MPAPSEPRTGLVLSGGGIRGAYEVGVVAGILEILGSDSTAPSPFDLYAGTSVGAINATFLACASHRGDLEIAELIRLWEGLELERYLRIRPFGLLPPPAAWKTWQRLFSRKSRVVDATAGRSLLDVDPLEALIRSRVQWHRLSTNLEQGHLDGLIVAALEIASGRTSVFAQLRDGVALRPSRDPRRRVHFEEIGPEHVLASAAIPVLFPSRRVGKRFYCDGGLRFNTPIAPAIRAGAERLVVISAMHRDLDTEESARAHIDYTVDYPSLSFLLGKLLNAVLLDPIVYDLQVLTRLNRLWSALEQTLTRDELATVSSLLEETRGAGYRRLDTLVFAPSVDIGMLAADYARRVLEQGRLDRLPRWFVRQALDSVASGDADFVSYLLFDGGFCGQLIALGRADACSQREEILRFFAPSTTVASRATTSP